MTQHKFGGNWSRQKLERVGLYLQEYTKALKNQPFRLLYIDAFAGTGYQTLKREDNPEQLLLPEFTEAETREFIDGSATIALQVEPPFQRYIFIENDESKYQELQKLREKFRDRRGRIDIVNADANEFIVQFCRSTNWSDERGVLFLDPYGMQVNWNTITAIANTQAIDLWYLFPLGVAVNRLLQRDGNISLAWRRRLDLIFGEQTWYDAFYETYTTPSLFGDTFETKKIGNFKAISEYFVKRLKTVFPSVAENPRALYNRTGNPLYLLCFAAANKRGGPIAKRIAEHILRMPD